jgi:hypothetical protein
MRIVAVTPGGIGSSSHRDNEPESRLLPDRVGQPTKFARGNRSF